MTAFPLADLALITLLLVEEQDKPKVLNFLRLGLHSPELINPQAAGL
jgi:hypothetical protein